MSFKQWVEPELLNQVDWIKKRNVTCQEWLNNHPDIISLDCSYFSISEHKSFINEIINKSKIKLKGKGIELGAGPGILSNSLIKIFPQIDVIYLLDIVPEIIPIQKKIAMFTGNENKIKSILGSFDDLQLDDNSLDFVIAFDAIHHSNNMSELFFKISKALKKGGKILCFDRATPNHISKEQIDYLLDIEYSDSYKKDHFIPITQKYNRRMNGEHEPYLNDWLNCANDNNLKIKVFLFQRKTLRNFIRGLWGLIPFNIKKMTKKGLNIITFKEAIINYFNFNINSNIDVRSLNYKPKHSKSPQGKMIFYFEKL